MKKLPVALIALCAVGIALFFLLHSPHDPARTVETPPAGLAGLPTASETDPKASNLSNVLLQKPGSVPPTPTVLPGSGVASLPTPADPPPVPLVDNLPPATVLDNMRMAVRQYGLRFNGNPVGTNPEITKALNGGNPKQVKFITPDSGLRINDRGELIDPWGTPFFFHQLSAMEMEVRSAGPDKVMWTDDDLVTK